MTEKQINILFNLINEKIEKNLRAIRETDDPVIRKRKNLYESIEKMKQNIEIEVEELLSIQNNLNKISLLSQNKLVDFGPGGNN